MPSTPHDVPVKKTALSSLGTAALVFWLGSGPLHAAFRQPPGDSGGSSGGRAGGRGRGGQPLSVRSGLRPTVLGQTAASTLGLSAAARPLPAPPPMDSLAVPPLSISPPRTGSARLLPGSPLRHQAVAGLGAGAPLTPPEPSRVLLEHPRVGRVVLDPPEAVPPSPGAGRSAPALSALESPLSGGSRSPSRSPKLRPFEPPRSPTPGSREGTPVTPGDKSGRRARFAFMKDLQGRPVPRSLAELSGSSFSSPNPVDGSPESGSSSASPSGVSARPRPERYQLPAGEDLIVARLEGSVAGGPPRAPGARESDSASMAVAWSPTPGAGASPSCLSGLGDSPFASPFVPALGPHSRTAPGSPLPAAAPGAAPAAARAEEAEATRSPLSTQAAGLVWRNPYPLKATIRLATGQEDPRSVLVHTRTTQQYVVLDGHSRVGLLGREEITISSSKLSGSLTFLVEYEGSPASEPVTLAVDGPEEDGDPGGLAEAQG